MVVDGLVDSKVVLVGQGDVNHSSVMLLSLISYYIAWMYLNLCTYVFFNIDDLVVFNAYEILRSVVELATYLVMDFCLFVCKLRFVPIPFFCRLIVLDD